MDMQQKKRPPATVLFIFGGSGDLNHRKLSPALYNLYLDDWMPENFAIIGLGRSEYTDAKFRQHIWEGVKAYSRRNKEDPEAWKAFSPSIYYQQANINDKDAYKKMVETVQEFGKQWGTKPKVIFYLAISPNLFSVVARQLGELELCKDADCTRIVVEKPFGHDLKSARELNQLFDGLFNEDQIYRIDHYLGKETVQNILAFRFANAMFEPIWNRNYIDHVQITAAEQVGVEDRGDYFDKAGGIRDMMQNHMLQLLCMVAMEAPVSFDANEVRNKKVDVLNAVRRINMDKVHDAAVRGQYSAGWMKGKEVKGYRQEKNVNPNSATETFAALKLYIDNWRWENVPFYLRTGKYLHQKTTLITIQFRPAPYYAFPMEAAYTWRPNRLMISIQPDMYIRIRFQAKRPGQSMTLAPVDMTFNYDEAYGDHTPEAYETLLLDVMQGNPTLFMRADQIEAAWGLMMPIIDAWKSRGAIDFPNYAPDSWGPEEADALIARDGHTWVNVPQP